MPCNEEHRQTDSKGKQGRRKRTKLIQEFIFDICQEGIGSEQQKGSDCTDG